MAERKPFQHDSRPRTSGLGRGGRFGLALASLAMLAAAPRAHASPTEVERAAARQLARTTAATTALANGGVPRDDVDRVRRALESHLAVLPEVALVTVVGDPGGRYDVLAWTRHSTFDACVLRAHPTTRADFHDIVDECSVDSGIENRVVRMSVAPRVAIDGQTDVHSSRLVAAESLDGETRMRVARLGLVDLNRDGTNETWAHVIEERIAYEYAEADEETRDEPDEIEVVTYHAVLRVFSADGYDLEPTALASDGTEGVASAAFAFRVTAPQRFELVYSCAARERTRGCRRGERHVPVTVDFVPSELSDDS